jgi:hypothetical protein
MRIINWFKNAFNMFRNDFLVDPFYLDNKDFGMKNVTIQQRGDRYVLFANTQVVGTYARERDARRGARRRGYNVA